MSLQWTAIATFLYFELVCSAVLLLPWISSSSWKKVFHSGLGRAAAAHSKLFFRIILALLVLCFLDSIREMNKYSHSPKEISSMNNHPNAVEHVHMKLFRAQRNYYIAGFSLFLWFVLQRLLAIIDVEALLEEHLKQAENTLAEKSAKNDDEQIANLTNQLSEAESRLKNKDQDLKDEQSHVKSLSEEYDRMSEEFKELQDKYDALRANGAGDKKEN